jgi:hypothetical protein
LVELARSFNPANGCESRLSGDPAPFGDGHSSRLNRKLPGFNKVLRDYAAWPIAGIAPKACFDRNHTNIIIL